MKVLPILSSLIPDKNLPHMEIGEKKRLNKSVVPSHYDLYMDIKENDFSGRVQIHLFADKPVTKFFLNSLDLEIKGIWIPAKEMALTHEVAESGFIAVTSPTELQGKFEVEIEYSGAYNEHIEGLYKTEYKGSLVFSTHSEPSDARRFLPCFDQPDMKSTFTVTLNIPEGFQALSNSPVDVKEGNKVVFAKTPLMSTYLLALVVGKFAKKEAVSSNGVPITVYTDESEKAWGEFALQVAPKCLDFFEEYFGIRYPLPKLDLVAIPAFAMGAMENWGIVTFRSTSLLYNPETASVHAKKNVAVTVCHELAHMWFGNLVTMDWWSDLWLNEGFATWAATLAVSGMPDLLPWDAWTSFLLDDYESGMTRDALESTHTVSADVKNPVDANNMFDTISYSKGASIIRMIEQWIGSDVFRDGIRAYLRKHQFGNATKEDLWDALNSAYSNKKMKDEGNKRAKLSIETANPNLGEEKVDVAGIVEPWIVTKGFPYLKIRESDDLIVIEQNRFTVGFKDNNPGVIWPIPVIIRWGNGDIEGVLMKEKEITVKKKAEYFKVNAGFTGFYRVLYNEETLDGIIEREYANLTERDRPADRLNLLRDSLAMAKGLYSSLPLKNLHYLKEEKNYEVLSSGLSVLFFMISVFYDDEEKKAYFKKLLNEIVAERISKVVLEKGAEKTSVNDTCLETLLLGSAIVTEDKEMLKKLRSKVDEAVTAGDISKVDVRGEFLRHAYISSVDKHYSNLLKLYKSKTASPWAKVYALAALGRTKNADNLANLFKEFNFVEEQDSIYLFNSFSENLECLDKIAELFMEHFISVRSHIGNSSLMKRGVLTVFGKAVSPGMTQKVSDFLEQVVAKDSELEEVVKECMDDINMRTQLRERYANLK